MKRKLLEITGSYVITIPKQFCDFYDYKPDDVSKIKPIGGGELRLRKV